VSGLRLAVCGKGGVGKSFIVGTLARALARMDRRVVVLDSDPVAGAAVSLGMGVITAPMLDEVVRETLNGWRLRKGIGAATAIKQCSRLGPDGVRLLQSGKAGSDGMRSAWPSIRAFGQVVRRLASDGVLPDWDVIADLPAGTRHTAFNWAPYASEYLVTTTPGSMARLTARRLVRLAEQRGARTQIVASRVGGAAELAAIETDVGPAALVIPADGRITAVDRAGLAPIDEIPESPAVRAVVELAGRLASERSVLR
jgi:CO dehydrogenase maturation factor